MQAHLEALPQFMCELMVWNSGTVTENQSTSSTCRLQDLQGMNSKASQRTKQKDSLSQAGPGPQPRYFFWWDVVRRVQKTATMTTMTMVMTPTDTMITSSMLLSRGDVGLPWGLLLPARVGRRGKAHLLHRKSKQRPPKTAGRSAGGEGLRSSVCFFGICQLFLSHCSSGSWSIDPFPTKSIKI